MKKMIMIVVAILISVSSVIPCLGATTGTIDCQSKSGVIALEKPGSLVVVKMMSCDQEVTIVGTEQGYIKIRIDNHLNGFIDARHVRILETQDATATEQEPVSPAAPSLTGFGEGRHISKPESAGNFLTKKDANKMMYSRKSAAVSFLLSLVVPGGGQYYNGQYLKGALMTGISLGAIAGSFAAWDDDFNASNSKSQSLALVGLGGCLWSMIDASISSQKINRALERKVLSWDVNKKMHISIKPDVSLAASSPAAHSLNYGAKLVLSIK
jgi:hypothetical protein